MAGPTGLEAVRSWRACSHQSEVCASVHQASSAVGARSANQEIVRKFVPMQPKLNHESKTPQSSFFPATGCTAVQFAVSRQKPKSRAADQGMRLAQGAARNRMSLRSGHHCWPCRTGEGQGGLLQKAARQQRLVAQTSEIQTPPAAQEQRHAPGCEQGVRQIQRLDDSSVHQPQCQAQKPTAATESIESNPGVGTVNDTQSCPQLRGFCVSWSLYN